MDFQILFVLHKEKSEFTSWSLNNLILKTYGNKDQLLKDRPAKISDYESSYKSLGLTTSDSERPRVKQRMIQSDCEWLWETTSDY